MTFEYIKTIDLEKTEAKSVIYGKNEVVIQSAPVGLTIDLNSKILDRDHFYGSTNVHDVVRFGDGFKSLIGRYDGRYGKWNRDRLAEEGIVILEYFSNEAERLSRKINGLAERIVQSPALYDDPEACKEYYEMAKYGYQILRFCAGSFGLSNTTVPVSFERAGLPSARMALGCGKDDIIPGEIRVVTKRTQIEGDSGEDLSVTVKWRNIQDAASLDGESLMIPDFVNPASGASTAAFVLAARERGGIPASIEHRAMFATRQGILFNKMALEGIGISPVFYTLGECDEMNDQYYLIGRPVGDAGHILRHFLPGWYIP